MGQSADQLKREIEGTRGELGGTLDAIGDRLSPGRMVERRKNRMINGLHNVRDRVMGTASDTGSAVADAAGGVADAAGEAVDTLKDTPDTVRRQTQGNPLAAGAIAVGVGVLLASIFPATDKERRAAEQLMDKAEPLKDELKQAGQEMAEHLKEPAREAVQQVKGAATESAEEISQTAKEAVGATSDSAREATETIRTEASGDMPGQQSRSVPG
jgi:gas vesicle protein